MSRKTGIRDWQVVKQVHQDGPVSHNSFHIMRDEAETRRDTIKAQGIRATVIKRGDKVPKNLKPLIDPSKPHKLETPPEMSTEEAVHLLDLEPVTA